MKRRLAEISRDRLIDEVVSRWEDVNKMEGDIANLRRRLREAELVARSDGSDVVLVGELEERIRVSDSRVRQLEGLVAELVEEGEGAPLERLEAAIRGDF